MTTIKRIRYASVFPFAVIEAEVETDDGKTIYVNMEVPEDGEKIKLEVGFNFRTLEAWAYDEPFSENTDTSVSYWRDEFYNDVVPFLVLHWNSNPKFDESIGWINQPINYM